MHSSVQWWTRRAIERLSIGRRRVLEIGSRDVNGTVRSLFTGPYLGVDIEAGEGVELVADAEALPFPSSSWPVVVSTEMLEHCRRPWLAVAEMARVLEPGGVLLLTCRGYDRRGCFPVHDHPWDLWRFSNLGLELLAADCGLDAHVEEDPGAPGCLVTAVK